LEQKVGYAWNSICGFFRCGLVQKGLFPFVDYKRAGTTYLSVVLEYIQNHTEGHWYYGTTSSTRNKQIVLGHVLRILLVSQPVVRVLPILGNWSKANGAEEWSCQYVNSCLSVCQRLFASCGQDTHFRLRKMGVLL
jgi:hypothetical protein